MRRLLMVLLVSAVLALVIMLACQGTYPNASTTARQEINAPVTAGVTAFIMGASYSDAHRNAVFIPKDITDSGVCTLEIRIDGSDNFLAEASLADFQLFSDALNLQQIQVASSQDLTPSPINIRALPRTSWKHKTLAAWVYIRSIQNGDQNGDLYACEIRLNGSDQYLPVLAEIQSMKQTLSTNYFTDIWPEIPAK